MKHLKQMCCFLIVMLVVATGCSVQGIARADSSGAVSEEQVDWKNPEHVRILTRAEFLDQLASSKHISYSEAAILETRQRTTFEASHPQIVSAAGHYEFMTVFTRQDFGAPIYHGVVELGVPTQVYVDGSFRQFSQVGSAYCQIVSPGYSSWEPMYATVTELSSTTIVLYGRGVLVSAVNMSISGSANICSALRSVGFDVGVTVSGTWYGRKVCQFSPYTYTLYPSS